MNTLLIRLTMFCLISVSSVELVLAQDTTDYNTFQRKEKDKFQQYKQSQEEDFETFCKTVLSEYKDYRDSCLAHLRRLREEENKYYALKLAEQWISHVPIEEAEPCMYMSHVGHIPSNHLTLPTPRRGTFYGYNVIVDNDQIGEARLRNVTPTEIANMWLKLDELDLCSNIATWLALAKAMRLDGWGYYKLINHIAQKIFPLNTSNEQRIFEFFVLSQSGYRCKLACTNTDRLILLLPFNIPVYYYPSLRTLGVLYYAMLPEKKISELSIVNEEFAKNGMLVELKLMEIPKLREDKLSGRKMVFNGVECIPIVNKNLLAYYSDYPMASIDFYYNASLDLDTQDFINILRTTCFAGCDDQYIANTLLSDFHKNFNYKTDHETWGRERYFFPIETLFYSYTDCEDLAILYRIFVDKLCKLKTAFLIYPNHLSVGIRIDKSVLNADYVSFDPTYKGAAPGDVMESLKTETVRIQE